MITRDFGITRTVFLVGHLAIKVPQHNYGWEKFLRGLLANLQEKLWGRGYDERLCPVLWASPGGWIIVMRRVDRICLEGEVNYADFQEGIPSGGFGEDEGAKVGEIIAIYRCDHGVAKVQLGDRQRHA